MGRRRKNRATKRLAANTASTGADGIITKARNKRKPGCPKAKLSETVAFRSEGRVVRKGDLVFADGVS